MSYRQAFHTSCRSGLSGHAGFQFNAASGGLDPEQLTRIAAEHSGYRPPPDAPPEPGPAEIAGLPVDLRFLPVEGVGPVISRTAYVGREFRGGEGEPDSGRFGNYFSHIVVGDGADPFGGLLPIELWGAPHWSTAESARTELPALEEIEPGPVDLDRILSQLMPRGVAVLAAVADAALGAVLGGPRAVVVEAEPDLAAAWVAWASFAMPPDRAPGLTFATFEGRPRVAESVRICVTTPACDTDFPPYELGSSVTVVDTAAPPAVADLSLYGRALESLAASGAEAVAAAIRDVPPGLDLASAGAELAVAARRLDLTSTAELPSSIAALRAHLGTTGAGTLAALAAHLPAGEGSGEAFDEWRRLYAAARQSDDPEATALVDAALERLLPSLGETPAALSEVDPGSPAVPSAGVLVKWLGLVSGAAEGERLGALLAAGLRLGLVGCNTALDKELVEPIARGFADPEVQAAYEEIGRAGNARVVEGVALELAAAAGAGNGLELLRRAAAQPLAREAVRANAAEAGDFESVAAWELLRAGSAGASRAAAVTALAARAETGGHESAIRGLYGDAGPTGPAEHVELLAGWGAAGREAPFLDYERALDCLGALSFRQAEEAEQLFGVLREGPRAVRGDPEYAAWRLRFEAAPERQAFRDWAEAAARLRRERETPLSSAREDELRGFAARVAVQSLGEQDYAQGIEILLRGMGRNWPVELGDALARRAAKSLNPQKPVARAFVLWQSPQGCREALLEVALPRATRDLSAGELDAVGESLDERRLPAWEGWLEEHPPRRAVSRAVRGVFRRGDED
jgi:GTPase-associated protein 1, N-terminal domain type 2/GTPase-associated protein 1, middle domain